MPDDKLGFAVSLVGPLVAFEREPLLCDQMERTFGSTFARGGFGPAMFDRIGTLANEAAGDRSRLARLDKRYLGVGAKAEKVFLPRAWPTIAEQPRFASLRPDA